MTDAIAGPAPRAADGPVLAADGRPLKASLRRALRAQKLRALMLIAPLLAFVLVTLPLPDRRHAVPLGREPDRAARPCRAPSWRSRDWDPATAPIPDEPVFAALHDDLVVAVEQKTNTRLGSRLNYEYSGMSSLMRGVGRDVKKMDPAQPFKDQFIAADKKWGDPAVWQTIKLFSGRYTSGYLLNALDLQLTPDGIRPEPAGATASTSSSSSAPSAMSLAITFLCFLLGYPIAYLLAILPLRTLEPAAHPRAAAVLDLAPGAHRVVEGVAAAAGRHQRRAGLARASSTTPTAW